jgi:hypothetical protein
MGPWRRRLALAIVGALLIGLAAPDARASVTSEEAAAKVAEQYAVQVLRVRAAVVDAIPVWLVTVMNPGGDRNDAFQVTTLAVDQESGNLIPAFRHGSSGYELPAAPDRDTRIEQRPDAMRSGAWR